MAFSLITSQIDTAPKHRLRALHRAEGLITSQIDTAPKQFSCRYSRPLSLITSQIDTAPKPGRSRTARPARLITSQIDTAPKPLYAKLDERGGDLNSTDEYYKGRVVSSDYPQTQLAGNEDYASAGQDRQYERVHDGTVLDMSERLRGYDDVDLQIINDLDPLFSCLLTVNINNW